MNTLKNKTGGGRKKKGRRKKEQRREGGMKRDAVLLKRTAIQGKSKAVSRGIDFFVLTS